MSRDTWSTADQQMVATAIARDKVLFLDRYGNEYPVVLVAWRGRLGRNKARIRFASGSEATVDIALIRPIPVLPTQTTVG